MRKQQTTTGSVELTSLCVFFRNAKNPNVRLFFSLENPAESMHHEDLHRLMAKYKFTIAFENAIGDDYITEKLWRPLKLGSVPVYMGSPSIQVNLLSNLFISFMWIQPCCNSLGLAASRQFRRVRVEFHFAGISSRLSPCLKQGRHCV